MRYRKIVVRIFLLLLLIVLAGACWYAWLAFPIISGFGAKNLCSAVFLQHRQAGTVIKEELGDFPLSLGSYTVNDMDSSVTGTVFGLGKRKAIYRKSLGATLVNDWPEEEIRAQQFNIPAPPTIGRDSIHWPMGDLAATSWPDAVNKNAMELALQHVLNEEHNGKPSATTAAIVLFDGQLVGEKYAPGFDRNSRMLGWSMSKSITGALIGTLVKAGKLAVDAPAPVPEWKGNEKQKITLKQLLQQTTGLDFNETYNGPSDVTNMLFKKGDMAAFTARRPLKYEPGTFFNYSSGNSNILSRIIRHVVGEKEYAAFPYRALFYKTGMYSMLLEPDASGTYVGSSYCYATARDYARFGLLYYNNGKWNGEQLFPENWVNETTRPFAADKLHRYGFQFWLNGPDEKDTAVSRYPDVPSDMFYADGFNGQSIYVIPSRKLVIVRLGLHVINENRFLREVMAAVRQ